MLARLRPRDQEERAKEEEEIRRRFLGGNRACVLSSGNLGILPAFSEGKSGYWAWILSSEILDKGKDYGF